jgi:hypothetical protein
MNSEAVSALIAKNPTLKAAKAKLEAMTPGSYCVHRSWGFGNQELVTSAARMESPENNPIHQELVLFKIHIRRRRRQRRRPDGEVAGVVVLRRPAVVDDG